MNEHRIEYYHSYRTTVKPRQGALVDRGANGGICGSDARVFAESPYRKVDVRGLENHEVTNVSIVSRPSMQQREKR